METLSSLYSSPPVDYGSASAYVDAVRKWMVDTQSWYNFHHMVALQMAASQRPAQVGFPTTITLQPNGVRRITARYRVPSFLRRIVAEIIDCFFVFALKIMVLYMLVEIEIVDIDRYERLLSEQGDFQTLIEVTHELFPLEIVSKIICSMLEAYLISYGFGGLPCGMTPGKSIMRLRVISCEDVLPVVGDPRSVDVTGSLRVPFKNSLQRAIFKNVLVNSLVPISSIVYVFNFNRALYDITSKTLVVSMDN